MKVWVHATGSNIGNKFNYFHVFTGVKDASNYVDVEKSLIRFGQSNQYFTEVGKAIFIGPSKSAQDFEETKRKIVGWIFSDVLDLSGDRNFVKETA